MDADEVLVIGAGVSGLSTGIRLLEVGYAVEIVAEARTPHTTSDVAAAVFFPYEAKPRDRVLRWSMRSLDAFTRLIEEGAAPVSWIELEERLAAPAEDPWWKDCVPAFLNHADVFSCRVPLIDMARYMPWLEERFHALGGRIRVGRVASLAEAATGRRAAINCAGLGAGTFLEDAALFPIRGQVVRVANPGLARCLVDETEPAAIRYVIPRRDDVVLGGTSEPGQWDTAADPQVEAAILARCRDLEPALVGARVLGRAVGLRPGRSEVRLEMHLLAGTECVVVHNYGHGGAGVTLSWGCAENVAELLGYVVPPGASRTSPSGSASDRTRTAP